MSPSPELSTGAVASDLLALALHFPMARVTVLSGLEEEALSRPEKRAGTRGGDDNFNAHQSGTIQLEFLTVEVGVFYSLA